MEPISHQIQKLHLMEEERRPSPPKTKPMEILSLKAIRNHPYPSYKRQHHHLDKCIRIQKIKKRLLRLNIEMHWELLKIE
jgi:hypothetical protein